MNRVIFGGSFNPPHNAHLEMLLAADKQNFVDEILVMPANIPPHKATGGDFAPKEHRIEMCSLLAKYSKKASLCTAETDRGGKSYMIDTVDFLKNQYPNDRLWLLIGADMVLTLKNWYKGEELIKKVGVLAVGRNTVSREDFASAIDEIKSLGGEVVWLDTETEPISSTLVREMLRKGENGAPIPKEVFNYVTKNQLYKG